jgi:O-antigen/teichoic acid export membrane protein
LPAFLGLALIANDLITLVFDDRYLAAGPVLMAVAVQGVFMPAGFFANLVFAGLDRSDLSLKFALAALVACTLVVWIASGYGAVAALLAAALVMGLAGVAATAMQIRLLHGSFLHFAAALAPGYSAVTAMVVALLVLKWRAPIDGALVSLITHVSIGVAVYVGWLFLLHRPQLLEAWEFLTHRRTEVIAPAAVSAPQA